MKLEVEREIVPCTCRGWETTVNCKKLCKCAPEYPALVGELEYASWLPVRPRGVLVMGQHTNGDHTPMDSGTPSTPLDGEKR